MASHDIRLLVSDVDGTLLNPQKQVTPATNNAIRKLRSAGLHFSLVTSRPPRGLKWLIESLDVQNPCAALNGGAIIDPDLTALSEQHVDASVAHGIIEIMRNYRLDLWIYTRTEWYVLCRDAPHVQHEVKAVRFSPLLFKTLEDIPDPIIKITGISDNYELVFACGDQLAAHFRGQLSISRSLPNHLDVTHCDANKGKAVIAIARALNISLANVASVGDGENDISMFRESGLSIAMAHAPAEVHRAATYTTSSNTNDGLAWAIEEIILKPK